MATTAESYSVRRAAAKAPVSAHPAFPAIVALWFAALLGLGSLVLPIALLETIVSVTGLARLIPAAAPPLGFTAHAGIAIAGAIAGALIGLALARKVAGASALEREERRFDFEQVRQCRPISAHEEFGEEGLGSTPGKLAAPALKRRSLAMSEDNSRSAYLQTVPLPGLSPDESSATAPSAEALPSAVEDVASTPLELGEFADFDLPDEHENEGETPEIAAALDSVRSRVNFSAENLTPQEPPMTDLPTSDALEGLELAPDAAEPLPFAAPSLHRAANEAFDEAEESFDEAADESYQEEPVVHLAVISDSDEAFVVGDDRPLAELGLVQLAARLGDLLEKRKATLVSRPAVIAREPVPPRAGAEDFEAAEPEDAARAIADFFGPASAPASAVETPESVMPIVPASLQSLSLDAVDDIDEASFSASFSLPLGSASTRAEPVDEDDEIEVSDEADDDAEYSSLLAMKNPFVRQQEFVRVEEPETDAEAIEPTVTFPSPAPLRTASEPRGEPEDVAPRPFDPPRNSLKTAAQSVTPPAPRDSGDAERNLRAALATLQRMSGAA